MRKFAFVVPVVLLAAGSTACATKKFVRGEVGQVNTKVAGPLDAARGDPGADRKNEPRIGEVDTKADAGRQVGAGGRAGGRGRRQGAMPPRPTRRPRPSRPPRKRLVYEVVLSEDQGNFKFGKAELPDQAKAGSTRW